MTTLYNITVVKAKCQMRKYTEEVGHARKETKINIIHNAPVVK